MFRQLALAMPSGDQKCPSQPSEPAERKRYRLKRTALRNACIANLRACLLFSSIRVSTDFGARHNHNINLCGTESECVIIISTYAERKVSVPVGYGSMGDNRQSFQAG